MRAKRSSSESGHDAWAFTRIASAQIVFLSLPEVASWSISALMAEAVTLQPSRVGRM
jgi:hypothetical protein